MGACNCGICEWCKPVSLAARPIQAAFVKYHSVEWYLMLAAGWTTAEVNYDQGSWRIAKIIKEGD